MVKVPLGRGLWENEGCPGILHSHDLIHQYRDHNFVIWILCCSILNDRKSGKICSLHHPSWVQFFFKNGVLQGHNVQLPSLSREN